MCYYRVGIRQPIWLMLSIPSQFLSFIFLTSTCSVECNLAPLLGHPSCTFTISFFSLVLQRPYLLLTLGRWILNVWDFVIFDQTFTLSSSEPIWTFPLPSYLHGLICLGTCLVLTLISRSICYLEALFTIKTLHTTLEQSSFHTPQLRAHLHLSQPLKSSLPTFAKSLSSSFSLIRICTCLFAHTSHLPAYIVRVPCGS